MKYKADTEKTTVTWKASKVIGGSYDGTFAIKDRAISDDVELSVNVTASK